MFFFNFFLKDIAYFATSIIRTITYLYFFCIKYVCTYLGCSTLAISDEKDELQATLGHRLVTSISIPL